MRTPLAQIHDSSFDIAVVGGGIHGAAIAREAAVRGLSVVLVEREDFGHGTSSRSSRLIHGGVRYLQQGNLKLVYEALHERERLLRAAPHLVRPAPLLMPFYRGTRAGRFHARMLSRIGLWLYDRMAGKSSLPRSRKHSPEECQTLFPGLRAAGLLGGVLFYDAATQDSRLTLANLLDAAEAGATLCNHAEVVGCGDDGVTVRDTLTGATVSIRAQRIVNAAGPHADAVRSVLAIDGAPLCRASRGSHLVLPPRDGEIGLAAFLDDGRIQFVVPHPDGTLVGTTDVDEAADQPEPTVPAEDVDYMLDALGALLDPPPGRGQIEFAYAGWRSLPTGAGPPGALNREAFVVDERCAAGSVHTIVGGKLTTHRALAERAVAAWRPGPSPTRDRPLPGGEGPQDPNDPLYRRHGSRSESIRQLAAVDASLLEPIAPNRDLLRVEAVYALQSLGAVTFVDLMLRRLIDSRGPVLDEGSLAAMHALYVAHRPADAPVRSFVEDRDELLAAVRRMRGDGTPARPVSGAVDPGQGAGGGIPAPGAPSRS